MKKYELLSKAIDESYNGNDKEAWKLVHEADEYSEKTDHVYSNLRDAVCSAMSMHKKMRRERGE